MFRQSGLAAIFVIASATGVAHADARYGVSFAALADDTHGGSYTLTGDISPNKFLTVSAGAGHSRAEPNAGNLADKFSGDSVQAGLDMHSEHFGVRGSWSRWQDSNSFKSTTANGAIYWRHDGLQLEIIGENRDFAVDYSFVSLLGRTVNDTARFSGNGAGAGASWYGTHWGVYAHGMSYSYDNKLQRLITISQLPSTTRIPRLQALTQSVLTRSAAPLDSDVSFGVERSFARSAVHVDATFSRDAIAGLRSRDYSVGWRYSLNSLLEAELTAGTTQTSGLGDVNYAGLSLSFRH